MLADAVSQSRHALAHEIFNIWVWPGVDLEGKWDRGRDRDCEIVDFLSCMWVHMQARKCASGCTRYAYCWILGD